MLIRSMPPDDEAARSAIGAVALDLLLEAVARLSRVPFSIAIACTPLRVIGGSSLPACRCDSSPAQYAASAGGT